MTLSIKLLVLGALFLGDLATAAFVGFRLMRQGRPAAAIAVSGAIMASFFMVAIILLLVVPGAEV
ncbi:MAG: hypothetical protein AAGK22_16195 [Acidobacteriota bacterium]